MRLCVIAVLLVSGCSGPSMPRERLAECFADAAYACYAAEARDDGEHGPRPCCGKCNGTGKVLSGDRLALVDCECDSTCACKTKSCVNGEKCSK